MDRIRIKGGRQLKGDIHISGAKNAALPLMVSAMLSDKPLTLHNVPRLADITTMIQLLTQHGVDISTAPGENGHAHGTTLVLNAGRIVSTTAPYDIVRKMRASVLVLGVLLAREGQAKVSLPGGCAIGARPVDLHIAGLRAMGAEIDIDGGYMVARTPKGLKGARYTFPKVSVGATENLMMAAALAKGTTVLDNAAREPDLVDIGEFLIAMGADISGLGTSTITINGVKQLAPATHATVPDRILAGTWAFAAVITQGDITINSARADHLELPLEKITAAGAVVTRFDNGFRVRMDHRPKAVDVATLPYPGFPTDLQPMVIAMNAVSDGTAIVTENVFEGRFMFVNELSRLGAQIHVEGHHASITGVGELSGAPVMATDIRAGVGLVLAGLVSEGETIVEDAFHIDRGFPGFAEALCALGADVSRI